MYVGGEGGCKFQFLKKKKNTRQCSSLNSFGLKILPSIVCKKFQQSPSYPPQTQLGMGD